MSITSAEAIHSAIQPVTPSILLGADLLDTVEAAIPPPPADTPLAWQHPSRPQLIATIAGYTRSDALQALLAAQIVTVRLAAEDNRWRSSAPDLPVPRASGLRRMTRRLMRAAAELERTLLRLQTRAATEGAPAVGALDLAAPIAPAEQDHQIDRAGSDAMHSLPPGTCPGGENRREAAPGGRAGGGRAGDPRARSGGADRAGGTGPPNRSRRQQRHEP